MLSCYTGSVEYYSQRSLFCAHSAVLRGAGCGQRPATARARYCPRRELHQYPFALILNPSNRKEVEQGSHAGAARLVGQVINVSAAVLIAAAARPLKVHRPKHMHTHHPVVTPWPGLTINRGGSKLPRNSFKTAKVSGCHINSFETT